MRAVFRVMEVGAAAQDFQRGISRMCHWLERLAGRLISESASSPALSPDEALSVARFISSQLESDRIAALLNAPISGADPPQLPVPPDERSGSHAHSDAGRPPALSASDKGLIPSSQGSAALSTESEPTSQVLLLVARAALL